MSNKEWVYPESLTHAEVTQVIALLLEREGLHIFRQRLSNGKGYEYDELTIEKMPEN